MQIYYFRLHIFHVGVCFYLENSPQFYQFFASLYSIHKIEILRPVLSSTNIPSRFLQWPQPTETNVELIASRTQE